MANPFQYAKKRAVEELSPKSTGDVTWYGDQGWSNAYGGTHQGNTPPQKFERFVLDAFRKNAIVRACIQEITTSLSEAPIRAYRDDKDGKRIWVHGHKIEKLFEYPNRRDSYVEFIERTGQHYFLGGNTFWEKRRNGFGQIDALIPIRPDLVSSAITDDDDFPLQYKVISASNASKTHTFDADDIVHIPDIDPLNSIFGMPRLLAALTEIQADNEATSYVNEVLHNHGSPGTIVAVDAERIRGQHLLERAEARWSEKFGPGAGRGKVAFLPGAHTIKEIGFNLKDLEFLNLRNVARSSICAVFSIDPLLLGISARGGTMGGAEHVEARRKLWMQTIIPLIRRWEAALNSFVAPEFGNIRVGFDLRQVTALQETRNEAIDRGVKMMRTGVASLPEIREEMTLDSDPDPGQIIVSSGRVSYIPVENLTKQHEIDTAPPVEEPKEDEDEEEDTGTEKEKETEKEDS